MKFSNGFWLAKKGMQIYPLAEAYSVRTDGRSITIHAPSRHIMGKGATLGGPTMTVELSSPAPDIIHVRAYHFKGGAEKGPHFDLNTGLTSSPVVTEDEKEIRLTSGNLNVRVKKIGEASQEDLFMGNLWSMDFYNGDRRLTGSGFRHMALIQDENTGCSFMREQLDLEVDECVYGLGERFTPFVKNGQTVDIWNEDGGTCTEQAYKNIPFYVTNRGYGVFVNHPEKVSFEVASEVVSRVQFSVPGEVIDYFVINGPSVKQVLSHYTLLTGRPALPPAWSFGLWLSTSFTTNYDEKTVTGFIDGMAQRNLPLQVFHFDCYWMQEFKLCNFKWDSRVFPDPCGMLKRLKAKGLHICVWINSYVSQESELFDEGKEKGYFIRRKNGDVWQWDLWEPGLAIVDFTNPEARKWFAGKLMALADMGVDCFKTDFGERIPVDDVLYYDGSDPKKMHNYYTYLYNQTVFKALENHFGKNKAVVFARSATAGSQKFPVHWGGDCSANYASMAETLRGGLSLGLSGFGFWSHDIGGFESTASPDVYKRWVAFGLLSSHSRLHGSNSYRVPWLFDEEAVDVLRFFTNLKCRLMPYIYKTAMDAAEKGFPVLRAMVMEFQDDPACDHLDRQYMLGDSLLVAPIFRSDSMVRYYLPKGQWISLITGEKIEGGCWRTEKHGYLSLPLMIRPNSIVALGDVDNTSDYDFARNAMLLVSPLGSGAKAETAVCNPDGAEELRVSAERTEKAVTLSYVGKGKPFTVKLLGISEVSSVKGASYKKESDGVRLTPENGGGSITVEL